MNETHRMSLIQNVEKSLKDFQIFFRMLPRNQKTDSVIKNHELKDFFGNLTVIEEDILEMRLKKIINQEHPYLPAIRIENLKIMRNLYQLSLLDLMQHYLVQKEKILKFINNIPIYYWERTGVHELEGHVTFEELIRRIIKNDQNNLLVLKTKFKN
ncbi:MAG: hypothetical protein GQ561_09235 [Calditrichae bacterium]|nr:hypothetical protein [Calditrichia bacterium]